MTKRKTAKRANTAKRTNAAKKTNAKRASSRKNARSANANLSSKEINQQALWETYRTLQTRVNRALDKLRTHCRNRAAPHILLQDKQELLFLLGECNYMAKNCAQIESNDRNQ